MSSLGCYSSNLIFARLFRKDVSSKCQLNHQLQQRSYRCSEKLDSNLLSNELHRLYVEKLSKKIYGSFIALTLTYMHLFTCRCCFSGISKLISILWESLQKEVWQSKLPKTFLMNDVFGFRVRDCVTRYPMCFPYDNLQARIKTHNCTERFKCEKTVFQNINFNKTSLGKKFMTTKRLLVDYMISMIWNWDTIRHDLWRCFVGLTLHFDRKNDHNSLR